MQKHLPGMFGEYKVNFMWCGDRNYHLSVTRSKCVAPESAFVAVKDSTLFRFYLAISSHTAMLRQLKPNVGTPLADRLELQARTTHLQTRKVIGITYVLYL